VTAGNQEIPDTITLPDGRTENVLWNGSPDLTLLPSPLRFGWIIQVFLLAGGVILFTDSYQAWADAFKNGITWTLEGKISTYQPFRMVLTPIGILFVLMAVFWKMPLRWIYSRTSYLITKNGVFILDTHTSRIRLELPFNGLKKPLRNGNFLELRPISTTNWADITRKIGPFPKPEKVYQVAANAWSAQNNNREKYA